MKPGTMKVPASAVSRPEGGTQFDPYEELDRLTADPEIKIHVAVCSVISMLNAIAELRTRHEDRNFLFD
jgi:hypothetical protein